MEEALDDFETKAWSVAVGQVEMLNWMLLSRYDEGKTNDNRAVEDEMLQVQTALRFLWIVFGRDRLSASARLVLDFVDYAHERGIPVSRELVRFMTAAAACIEPDYGDQ